MSKTYKDQRHYQAKHYNHRGTLEPKDINEPEWWRLNRFHRNTTQAGYWYNISYRRLRRKCKKMLAAGDYDNLPKKPMNVDWIID